MSGGAELFIQPSQLVTTVPSGAGKWQSGVPAPGLASYGVPAVAGLPTCRNLASSSPPTLLEEYEIYSYNIGWAVEADFTAAPTDAPQLTLALKLLVNDRVRFSTADMATAGSFAATGFLATGAFVSDLVNPISLGARDRLGISLAVLVSPVVDSALHVVIGTQLSAGTPNPVVEPFESTISYRVLDIPASRRL